MGTFKESMKGKELAVSSIPCLKPNSFRSIQRVKIHLVEALSPWQYLIHKTNITRSKQHINPNIVLVGDINAQVSPIDKLSQQKLNKNHWS